MGTQGAMAQEAAQRRALCLGGGRGAQARAPERGEGEEDCAKPASTAHMGNCLGWLCLTPGNQVVQRIKAVEGQTRLLVVDQETDEELRRRQLTCTEEMAQRGLPPAHYPWEPKPDWAHTGGRSSDAGKKDVSGPLRELRPRLCHLRKGPQG
ncbi:SLC9A3R2 isoform 1, partial [Pongo abelii]